MTVNELISRLSLETLNLADGERAVTGAYTGDLLSWAMSRAVAGDMWITIMTNVNVIAVASLVDVACVIIAEDAELDPEVAERARAQGINLLRSPLPAYKICNEPLHL